MELHLKTPSLSSVKLQFDLTWQVFVVSETGEVFVLAAQWSNVLSYIQYKAFNPAQMANQNEIHSHCSIPAHYWNILGLAGHGPL